MEFLVYKHNKVSNSKRAYPKTKRCPANERDASYFKSKFKRQNQ